MDYRNQSLGALAIAIPRASRLFRQHQLDFCCGGRQSLAHAAERRRLDIDRLENELAATGRHAGAKPGLAHSAAR